MILGRRTFLLGSSWGISMIFLAESSLVSFNALADRLKIDESSWLVLKAR